MAERRFQPMLAFPVRFVPGDEGGVLATFPDVPEALNWGKDEDEAMDGALRSLESALSAYVADGHPLPRPSEICGAPTIVTRRYGPSGE